MKTLFQRTFNIEDAKQIVRILHPDITGVQLAGIKMYAQYTWMVISFGAGSYGKIDIGINNHDQQGLWGDWVTKKHILEHLKQDKIRWRIWRMSLDRSYNKYKEDSQTAGIYPYEDRLNGKAYDILYSKYSLPTVEEFYNYYYSD